jgi:hypothetical protein
MLFSHDVHQIENAWRKAICPGNLILPGMKTWHTMLKLALVPELLHQWLH